MIELRRDGDERAVADLGAGGGRLEVVGGLGFRLAETSFHLEEGPELLWVNPYRLLARGRLLGYARTRPVDRFEVVDGAAVAEWDPFDSHAVRLSVRTRVVDDSTIDSTFTAEAEVDVDDYEVFVSSYFTPNQTPSFWARRYPFVDGDPVWVTKGSGPEHEPTSWPRDEAGAQQLFDGRWSEGHPPLWWVPGSYYHAPLMIQAHRWVAHAVITMARPESCAGISGLWGYHNSQYFHLFGRTLAAGESVEATVRMVIARGAAGTDALQEQAVAAYESFVTRPMAFEAGVTGFGDSSLKKPD